MNIKARRQQCALELPAQLKQIAPNVLRAYPVQAAYVYGSVARGAILPSGDVDVALVLETPFLERVRKEGLLRGG